MKKRATFVVALWLVGAGLAQAQSLADVARAEAARRQEVTQPSKVYTNDTLKPDFTTAEPSPAVSPAPSAAGGAASAPAGDAAPAATSAPSGDTPVRDQAYWSNRIAEARSQVERSRAFAAALQNRIDMLWTDFVNRDNPVERAGIEQERNKALSELDRVNKDIESQAQAVTDIEDEARRAGVPPGWLRPS